MLQHGAAKYRVRGQHFWQHHEVQVQQQGTDGWFTAGSFSTVLLEKKKDVLSTFWIFLDETMKHQKIMLFGFG